MLTYFLLLTFAAAIGFALGKIHERDSHNAEIRKSDDGGRLGVSNLRGRHGS